MTIWLFWSGIRVRKRPFNIVIMKKILVPVDMSPSSGAALRLATYLAEVLDHNLEIIHVFDPLLSPSQTFFAGERIEEKVRLEREIESFSRREVDPVLATFQGRVDILPVVNVVVMEGIPAATITGLSQREDIALIVMGGVGAGSGTRPPGIFGSVARNVAAQSGCPVILLPKTYHFTGVERMAVAFEEPADIRAATSFLRKLIKGLHCEVRYVHVQATDQVLEGKREEKFVEMSFGADFPSYTYKFDSLPAGKVAQSLLQYTVDSEIDLLVVGRKHRSFFDNLFHGGHLGPIVRKSEVPVLITPC